MKHKFFTAICTCMLFVPWTILPLRMFDWALASPTAEHMILGYAAFMIFSGIFTAACYFGAKAKGSLMKICLVANSLYAVVGAGALALIAVG